MAPWTANVRNYFSLVPAQPVRRLTILFHEHCLSHPPRVEEEEEVRPRLPNGRVGPRLIAAPVVLVLGVVSAKCPSGKGGNRYRDPLGSVYATVAGIFHG